MRILLKLIYFIVFLALMFVAMFLGGVSGVAGSFYLMVKEGAILDNLILGIAGLSIALLVVLILRGQNKKVLRQRKQLEQEQARLEEENEG